MTYARRDVLRDTPFPGTTLLSQVIDLDIQEESQYPGSLSLSYFYFTLVPIIQVLLPKETLSMISLALLTIFFNLLRLLTLNNISQVDFVCQV